MVNIWGIFTKATYQGTISQIWKFLSDHFPKVMLGLCKGGGVKCCSMTDLESAAWEISHLGSCCSWENTLGKLPLGKMPLWKFFTKSSERYTAYPLLMKCKCNILMFVTSFQIDYQSFCELLRALFFLMVM